MLIARSEWIFSVLPKTEVLLKVTGMTASPHYPRYQYSTIEQAFQGTNATDTANCYVSNPEKNGYAHIDIQEAGVTKIKLLNRNTAS